MHVHCGRGSILLWRHCDMLCTSGFMDDVTFGHNDLNGRVLMKAINTVRILYCWLMGYIKTGVRVSTHLEKSQGIPKWSGKSWEIKKSQGKLKSVSWQKMTRRHYLATLECKKTFWQPGLHPGPHCGSLQRSLWSPSWYGGDWLPPPWEPHPYCWP